MKFLCGSRDFKKKVSLGRPIIFLSGLDRFMSFGSPLVQGYIKRRFNDGFIVYVKARAVSIENKLIKLFRNVYSFGATNLEMVHMLNVFCCSFLEQ